MTRYFFILLFYFICLTVKGDEGFSILVGIFDVKDPEIQKLISDLKKISPKGVSVVTKDSEFSSDKMIMIEFFKLKDEANIFNEKLKTDFKKYAELSYVISHGQKKSDLKEESEATGPFGQRTLVGRERAIKLYGGSESTETSVNSALTWLANHQEKDGHWDSGKYEGGGTSEVDCAVAGAALLAFLSAGYTDKSGQWQENVKSAINWLVKNQKPSGEWDKRNYTNGICTMAIAEAVGMGCGGPAAKKSVLLAASFLLAHQNSSGMFDYVGPSGRDDMSASGWCLMGLKSAMLAGVKEKEIMDSLKKASACLDKTGGTKDNTNTTKGLSWYTPDFTAGDGTACQAIAMIIREITGWKKTAPWLVAAAEGQVSKVYSSYAGADVYRIYYTSIALFQFGGNYWTSWNQPVSKMLMAAQRQDGEMKGSWDKNGSHLDKGGRVMYTALLCLSLEAYYRYKPMMK